MTEEQLQEFCGQNVTLKYADRALSGKLICGAEAQMTVGRPYAIETWRRDATVGTYDTHREGIVGAEPIESVELLDEPIDEEIKDAAEDAQTPG
jgi:hypothetical protein